MSRALHILAFVLTSLLLPLHVSAQDPETLRDLGVLPPASSEGSRSNEQNEVRHVLADLNVSPRYDDVLNLAIDGEHLSFTCGDVGIELFVDANEYLETGRLFSGDTMAHIVTVNGELSKIGVLRIVPEGNSAVAVYDVAVLHGDGTWSTLYETSYTVFAHEVYDAYLTSLGVPSMPQREFEIFITAETPAEKCLSNLTKAGVRTTLTEHHGQLLDVITWRSVAPIGVPEDFDQHMLDGTHDCHDVRFAAFWNSPATTRADALNEPGNYVMLTLVVDGKFSGYVLNSNSDGYINRSYGLDINGTWHVYRHMPEGHDHGRLGALFQRVMPADSSLADLKNAVADCLDEAYQFAESQLSGS